MEDDHESLPGLPGFPAFGEATQDVREGGARASGEPGREVHPQHAGGEGSNVELLNVVKTMLEQQQMLISRTQ